MIVDGLVLTAAGMLVVFSFLALLVLTMGGMSRAILRWFPEPDEPAPPARTRHAAAEDQAAVAVAIAVAHIHR